MLRNHRWVVILTGLAVGAPAAWADNDRDKDRDDRDSKLEDRVENRLNADDKLDHINIDVDKGVVTMTGEVATRAERARAERMARAEGARRVVNKLEIDLDKTAANIDERAKERKEKIDDRADKQKEAIDRETEAAKDRLERQASAPVATTPAPTPARRVERNEVVRSAGDAWITTKVKTKFLADDMLDRSDLHVDTDNKGVVTLSGTVPSETARNRAVEIARTTEGVRQVVDKVVVGAPVIR
jgi:hyperosmotically inducible periplasmic protein